MATRFKAVYTNGCVMWAGNKRALATSILSKSGMAPQEIERHARAFIRVRRGDMIAVYRQRGDFGLRQPFPVNVHVRSAICATRRFGRQHKRRTFHQWKIGRDVDGADPAQIHVRQC